MSTLDAIKALSASQVKLVNALIALQATVTAQQTALTALQADTQANFDALATWVKTQCDAMMARLP